MKFKNYIITFSTTFLLVLTLFIPVKAYNGTPKDTVDSLYCENYSNGQQKSSIFDYQNHVVVNINSTADMTGYNVTLNVDGVKYSSDGKVLYKEGKPLIDLSKKGFEDKTIGKYLSGICVTDLSYDKWNGHTIIYIAGLIFIPYANDFTDTSVYQNQTVKLGTPYMILLSYIDDDNYSDVYPYNSINNKCAIEGFAPAQEHWGCPYDTSFNDSVDTPEGKMFKYAYIANVVHPHITKSKAYDHTLYVLFEELDWTIKDRHIAVYNVNTNRDSYTFADTKSKFTQQFYMTFDYINNNGRSNSVNYTELSLYDLYVFEIAKDRLIMISASKPIQLMFNIDVSEYMNAKMMSISWRDS